MQEKASPSPGSWCNSASDGETPCEQCYPNDPVLSAAEVTYLPVCCSGGGSQWLPE